MKLDADEKEILDSVERREWRAARAPKRAQSRYSRYAKATFKKDRRLNIRISTMDLESECSRIFTRVQIEGSQPSIPTALYVVAA